MKRFEGKKVLITGGSRGIGYSTANAFIEAGASVVITGRSDSVLSAARSLGENAAGLVWDITQMEMMPQKFEEAVTILDGLDVLINNAGIVVGPDNCGSFLETTLTDWDAILNTNARSVFFMCQTAAKYFLQKKMPGHIVNVCSNMGYRMISSEPYGISKWAVRGMTMGIGRVLAKDGIIVNAVCPGPVTTDMMGWTVENDNYFPHIPIKRYSTPEEVANVILFLAASETIVGEALVADGGERLY